MLPDEPCADPFGASVEAEGALTGHPALTAEFVGSLGQWQANAPSFSRLAAPTDSAPRGDWRDPTVPERSREEIVTTDSERGFKLTRDGVHGKSILHSRLYGNELVERLRETAERDEIRFWAGRLAALVNDTRFALPLACITFPEEGGLEETLAEEVARELDLPLVACFEKVGGGHHSVLNDRLNNPPQYSYRFPADPNRVVLVVDDAYVTGVTAEACRVAAGDTPLFFLCLTRS